MYSHRNARQYIGQHVHCHTHFGTFEGVILHCTKEHLILAPVQKTAQPNMAGGMPGAGMPMTVDPDRYGPGPGPGGQGGPGGPGGQGGPGSGWHFAIPLAAILGITAVGMHWW